MDKKKIVTLIDFIKKKLDCIAECEYSHQELSEIEDACDEILKEIGNGNHIF